MRIKKKSKKVKRCNPIRITKENGKKKMAPKKWPKKNGPKKMAMGGLEPPTSEL